jgi:GntR family transcriptional repressor for pyruvate dehydrogenase complex
MFHKISQKKISQEVFEQVRDIITSGSLRPGDRLPSERELAMQMDVGRSSIREAMLRLEVLGFIEFRSGTGAYVRSLTATSLGEGIDNLIAESRTISELLELRKVLESWAASVAAQRANPEEIKQFGRCIQRMRREKTAPKGAHLNLEFHMLLARATHNTLFFHLFETISDWIGKVTQELQKGMYHDPLVHQQLLDQHMAILSAIQDRNPAAAAAAVTAHIDFTIAGIQANQAAKPSVEKE